MLNDSSYRYLKRTFAFLTVLLIGTIFLIMVTNDFIVVQYNSISLYFLIGIFIFYIVITLLGIKRKININRVLIIFIVTSILIVIGLFAQDILADYVLSLHDSCPQEFCPIDSYSVYVGNLADWYLNIYFFIFVGFIIVSINQLLDNKLIKKVSTYKSESDRIIKLNTFSIILEKIALYLLIAFMSFDILSLGIAARLISVEWKLLLIISMVWIIIICDTKQIKYHVNLRRLNWVNTILLLVISFSLCFTSMYEGINFKMMSMPNRHFNFWILVAGVLLFLAAINHGLKLMRCDYE